MAFIPPRFNPSQPIPNNPFYSPLQYALQGVIGSLVVGSGLTVNYLNAVLTSGGGGGGAVSQIIGGAGITVSPAGGTGAVTVSLAGGASAVTAVTASNPLQSTGGATPDISLNPSGVTAGTYTNPTITVDTYGRISLAADGTGINSVTATSPIQSSGGVNPVLSLATSGVVAGTYPAATITVTDKGIVTSAIATSVINSITGTAPISVTTGGTPVVSLDTSGVVAGSYTNTSLTVDAFGRLTAASSGTAPVTAVTATAPLASSGGATPDITLSPSGVVAGSYTYPSITVDTFGRITVAASNGAPDTTVTAPITNTGTNVAPIIGIQTATTGQLGAVRIGTNIDVASGVISVASSSTTASGIVQLNDTVSSTSITEALTAAQGKNLQDQINALTFSGGLTLAGTFDATTSQMLTVTSSGTAAGFVVGDDLVGAAAGNTDYFVIVTTGGSYTPPGAGGPILTLGTLVGGTGYTPGTYLAEPLVGGSGTGATADITVDGAGVVTSAVLVSGGLGYNVGNSLTALSTAGTPWSIDVATVGPSTPFVTSQGDWLLSNGVTWQYLNVGTDLPIASTGTAGIVELATSAETQTGTDTTRAVTPAGAAATYVPIAALTGKGAIISASAANVPATLSVGTDGQVLTACATAASGLCWTSVSGAADIPCAAITAKGDLLTGTAASAVTALTVGTNNQILVACSAATTGLCWITSADIPCAAYTAKGDILGGVAPGSILTLGTLVGGSGYTPGTYLGAPLVGGSGSGALANITVNGAGVVTAVSLTSPGSGYTVGDSLTFFTPTGTPWSIPVATIGGTYAALPVGANGLVLVSDSTCATGMKWAAGGAAGLPATPTVFGTVKGCTTLTNTALGCNALCAVTTGFSNVMLGNLAGANITTGSCNVIIGSGVGAPGTGNCQLAIGAGQGFCWITGFANLSVQFPRGVTDCTGSRGCLGQFLTAVDASGGGLCWTDGCATPICRGLVLGCTDNTNAALGCNALKSNSGVSNGNIAIGLNALCSTTVGLSHVAIGRNAFCTNTGGLDSVFIGNSAGLLSTASSSVGVGACSLCAASGLFNTALGGGAGSNITTGAQNVVIGPNVAIPVATGSCQLALGFSATENWLTGCSDKSIQPGAGIRDCCGCVGTKGQVLSATGAVGGSSVLWRNIPGCQLIRTSTATTSWVSPAFTPRVFSYETVVCDTTGWYSAPTGQFTPQIAGFYMVNAMARTYCNGLEGYLTVTCNNVPLINSGGPGSAAATISTLVYMNGTTDFLKTQLTSASTTGTTTQTALQSRLAIALLIPT